MKISDIVHQIRVDFMVTKEVKRYVYIYVIVAKNIYLIDSGVAGSDKAVEEYLQSIGRDIMEVKAIFLTHSHPDHIGGAMAIKRKSNCSVYACQGESDWITDIDKQFSERRIPNFYSLVNQSVSIDKYIKDGDSIEIEENLHIQVINTAGHSKESLTFLLKEHRIAFIGDAVPIVGDIPIYISFKQSLKSLNKLQLMEYVDTYCPAWDVVYTKEELDIKIQAGYEYLLKINQYVIDELQELTSEDIRMLLDRNCSSTEATDKAAILQQIVRKVSNKMDKAFFTSNPLFKTGIMSNIEEYCYQ